METEMFKELLESVKEAKNIMDGKVQPSRKFLFEETKSEIKDARAEKNLLKSEDISYIENLSKQDLELDLVVEDKYKKE